MKEQKDNSKVLLSISATLVVTIISIAVTIFSLNSDNIFVQSLYIILVILLVGIVIAIYVHIAAIEFKENKEHYQKITKDIELLPAIPHLFIFKSRKDIFTILDNGDAELEWDFEIEKETDSNIAFINFPVVCEREDNNTSMEAVSTIVKELIVNGKKQNGAEYELKSISFAKQNNRAIEQGCIHVPLHLSDAKNEVINIKIILVFKGIFCEFKNGEFVVVDIPYVTRNLMLEVKPQSSQKRIDVTNNFFNAHEVNGKNTDDEEQTKQKKKCLTDNNVLRWNTQYPKLGYRYELFFVLRDDEMM